MRSDILKKLYQNPNYLYYLRTHPKWYYYLDLDPNYFVLFERNVQKETKTTAYDKIESIKKQINFASSIINYFRKQ